MPRRGSLVQRTVPPVTAHQLAPSKAGRNGARLTTSRERPDEMDDETSRRRRWQMAADAWNQVSSALGLHLPLPAREFPKRPSDFTHLREAREWLAWMHGELSAGHEEAAK